MKWLALLALVACGRFGFDSSHRPVDAAIDAAPDPIGCADGVRDELTDLAMYPAIAACKASWSGALNLRMPPTGAACGDRIGLCASPADACSVGWHVCSSSGSIAELLVLTGPQCDDITGSYVAASSHCLPPGASCSVAMPVGECPIDDTMGDCTQPICCGVGCDDTNSCQDGVWPGATHENAHQGPSCGTTNATTQDGILCCRD